MRVRNGKDITFLYSTDGKKFTILNKTPINGAYLPPWDRAVRAGVVAKGQPEEKGVFTEFTMQNSIGK